MSSPLAVAAKLNQALSSTTTSPTATKQALRRISSLSLTPPAAAAARTSTPLRRTNRTLSHLSAYPTPQPARIMSTINQNGTAASSNGNKPLLMIPGPTEYHPEVLQALGQPSLSHTSPALIEEFGQALERLRDVLGGKDGTQPVILTGSGSLGWDVIAANLCERGDKALVLNTGYFSDSYAVCCETYGIEVTQVRTPVGDVPNEDEVRKALKADKFKLICITQVDTSTAVINDVQKWTRIIKELQPEALISVDGVCSFGGEELKFSEWNVDAGMSCSQKALGAPPGLSVMLFSERAIQAVKSRSTPVGTYYGNLNYWLPIMQAYEQRKPSYFGTPNVNLIKALNKSLSILQKLTMPKIVEQHKTTARKFRAAVQALGLSMVTTSADHAANTLSAIYYPKNQSNFKKDQFLPTVTKHGVILAGGLHKDIKPDYFRVGTMGYSVWGEGRQDVRKVVEAIEASLVEVGASGIKEGTALQAFDKQQ